MKNLNEEFVGLDELFPEDTEVTDQQDMATMLEAR